MFERYTEKARRVVFFARYEAYQVGSPVIDTEHLLLGILRETTSVTRMLPPDASQKIRARIEGRTPARAKISTSIDLPLSNAGKRVLAYGAEEAERLNHRHIGSEHLFLGLFREKGCVAAQVLGPFGLKLEELRRKFEAATEERVPGLSSRSPYRGMATSPRSTVTIHGELFALAYVRNAMSRCRERNWLWRKVPWSPRDVAIHRKTKKVSFDLSLTGEAENFELVKDGWTKDYCAICRWELFASADDHGNGYTNGRDWVCNECYEKFWDRPDFISGSYAEIT